MSNQARELTIAAAQLSAGVRLCEQKLAEKHNVGLVAAASMAASLEPLLKPVGELAAQPDMALRNLDVSRLSPPWLRWASSSHTLSMLP